MFQINHGNKRERDNGSKNSLVCVLGAWQHMVLEITCQRLKVNPIKKKKGLKENEEEEREPAQKYV